MKCLSCNSQNIDPGKFTCWCGKEYKKMLMDGGRIILDSQCSCHLKSKIMRFAMYMDTTPQEIKRIVERDEPIIEKKEEIHNESIIETPKEELKSEEPKQESDLARKIREILEAKEEIKIQEEPNAEPEQTKATEPYPPTPQKELSPLEKALTGMEETKK